MNHTHSRASILLAVVALATVPLLRGQTTAEPAKTAPTANSPLGSSPLEDETMVLSPFVVSSSEDAGYAAKSTLAGTRIRTELKDVGSSISVFTQKFLEDTNSKSAESLLVYTPNVQVSGQGGNFVGKGDGKILTDTSTDLNATTRVRGLDAADNTRDFFLTGIPWDSYNTGRIDIQRGPNSILFGIGSPAGIVNASINPAAFKDSNKVEVQFGSFGSERFTADFNKVIIPNELAIRVSLLRDDTKYRQDPAFRDDHRAFGALKWDPSFLNKGWGHTSLRANFEKGNILANMPRITPPLDAISPWFYGTNKKLFDPQDVNLGLKSSSPFYDGVAANNSVAAYVTTNASGSQTGAFVEPGSDVPASQYYLPLSIATFDKFGRRSNFVGSSIDAWKARSLTDSTIFDFYNHLLEGPNKFERLDFTAFNVTLSQTFLDDKLGFEVAYDKQKVYNGGYNFLSPNGAAVTVDILTERTFNAPNADVARPLVISTGGFGQWSEDTKEVWRATVFGDLDFNRITGKDSWAAKIFGRNTFTGLAVRQKDNNRYANYTGYLTNAPFISVNQSDPIHVESFFGNQLNLMNYLGEAVPQSATSAAGLHLEGLKGKVMPQSASVTVWNYATGSTTSIPLPIINNVDADDRSKRYNNGFMSEGIVDSTAFVWQGYWFGGTVVPMFGYRTDKAESRSSSATQLPENVLPGQPRFADIYGAWDLPDEGATATVHSKTYSLVTHLPEGLRQRLPGHMDVSLHYNQSENVRPGAGYADIYGNTIPDPTGKTKEYGVTISALDDKLSLKISHYKTTVHNALISGAFSSDTQQYLAMTDSWGQWRAYEFRDSIEHNSTITGPNSTGIASTNYGTSSDGHVLTWLPDGLPKGHVDGSGKVVFDYTQAEIDTAWAKEKASVADWFLPENQLPESIVTNWNLKDYHNPAHVGFPQGSTPGGLQVTGDTISQGLEFELVANPIKGLNVAFNASKTSAKRTDIAQSFVDYVESRWEVFQGPAGDMRYWGTSGAAAGRPELGDLNANPDQSDPGSFDGDGWSARGHFRRAVMAPYWLFRALENSDVAELRPWTFNVVGNYEFQEGRLRGFNVGGSYRWQNKNIVGFPVITDSAGVESYDVDHPYKGSTEGIADAWIGYERKIGRRFIWRTQLNVRNVLATDSLSRVTVQPDGSPAAYRIPEPRTFTWSNSLKF